MSVPYIGGDPASFVCLHVIAPVIEKIPVRVCSAKNPAKQKRQIQVWHWVELAVFESWWVPALGERGFQLTNRIEQEFKRLMADYRIRGGWYAMQVQDVAGYIQQAADNEQIPLLSAADYRRLIPSSDELDRITMRKHRMVA